MDNEEEVLNKKKWSSPELIILDISDIEGGWPGFYEADGGVISES